MVPSPTSDAGAAGVTSAAGVADAVVAVSFLAFEVSPEILLSVLVTSSMLLSYSLLPFSVAGYFSSAV